MVSSSGGELHIANPWVVVQVQLERMG